MFDDYGDCIDELSTESMDMTEEATDFCEKGDITTDNTFEDIPDMTAVEDITLEMDDIHKDCISLDGVMEQNELSFEEDFAKRIDDPDCNDMQEDMQTLSDLQDLSGDEIMEKYATEQSEIEIDSEICDSLNAINYENDFTLSERMGDPELFDKLEEGNYKYDENSFGKQAAGSLDLVEEPKRDQRTQQMAGSDDRRPDDDGGHLIGARFGGAAGEENLDAQNSNLNRGSYKQMENQWAEALDNGDKVFVDVATYKSNGSDRPDAYLGYSITEHNDGSRNWDAFSFQNENSEILEEWETIVESME